MAITKNGLAGAYSFSGVSTSTPTVAVGGTSQTGVVMIAHISFTSVNSTTQSVTSITDSVGNTWQLYHSSSSGSGWDLPNTIGGVQKGFTQEIWYTKNASVGSSINVTINFSATIDACVANFSPKYLGCDLTQPFDLNASLPKEKKGTSLQAEQLTGISTTNAHIVPIWCLALYGDEISVQNVTFNAVARDNMVSTQRNNAEFVKAQFADGAALTGPYSSVTYNAPTNGSNFWLVGFAITSDASATDGNATGTTSTVTASLIAGAIVGEASGATITTTASVIAGTAAEFVFADGDTVSATASILAGSTSTSAIDGTKIYEFAASQVASTIYQTVNYDSIWGRGDRIANGLMTAGDYGWATVFASANQGFDDGYGVGLGNGPAQNGSTAGSAFWWHFAEDQLVDLRGITPIGTDELDDYPPMWTLYGGISVGNISTAPYTADFDGFNITQTDPFTGTALTLYHKEIEFEPRAYVAYPHYELILRSGVRADFVSRLCNEFWLQVAHSNLDGGDRRPSAAADRRVAFTMSSDWIGSTDDASTFNTPQLALFDGIAEFMTGKRLARMGAASNISNPVSTVGAWFQFVFPRPVSFKHLMFVNDNNLHESYTGDTPDKFGIWHWEYSTDSGGSWTSVGDSWSFVDGATYMVAPRSGLFDLPPVGDDGLGATHWRMVLDQGPAFGGSVGNHNQIIFDLDDVTGQAPPLEILFTDDTDGIPAVATIGSPGNPFEIILSDGTTDGLTLDAVINVPNPVLTIAFTDEGTFDTWSDLYPSIVVQTILVTTGR